MTKKLKWKRRSFANSDLEMPIERHHTTPTWRSSNYLVIDLETTGLDTCKDHIISYGAVPIRDGRIVASDAAYSLVRSERESSEAALRTHCLRKQDLATAPSIDECVDRLDELLRGHILVAHGAWIEHSFLRRAFKCSQRVFTSNVIDTAKLASIVLDIPTRPNHSVALEYAASRMGLPVHTPHHALGDAMTTANLFLALATKLERSDGIRAGSRLITLST
ncbi:PolC-type DNA polymerase III [Rhodococcus sp. NPDC056960]|uniref:3'-5' exonuclease n=1 Tax=Rhodococcus sp. NPDC056960 TaxID=3345982 RepID=UPI003624D766